MDKKMNKNKAMRTASGLFVATMLTTSVVSGTYAKYVTEDEASDNARVAVFGVKVEAGGELFAQTYLKETNTPGGKSDGKPGTTGDGISVKSQAQYTSNLVKEYDVAAGGAESAKVNNVVAPGTQSSNDGLTLSLSGTPEVDVDIVFVFDKTSDIWLGANGTKEGDTKYCYPNMTSGSVYNGTFETNDVFRVNETYYPVEFTLTDSDSTVLVGSEATEQEYKDGTLTNVQSYIISKIKTGTSGTDYTEVIQDGKTTITYHAKAGTDLGEKFGLDGLKLTWKWDFDDDTNGTYDKEDTLLGDLAGIM